MKCAHVESLVSFLTWAWHNQNRTRVFRTEKQRFARYSTNFAFNTRCVWYLPHTKVRVVSCLLPSLFSLFWVFRYSHTQLRSFYPVSTFDGVHMRKNTSLSLSAQFQCSRSGAEEPGNETSWWCCYYPLSQNFSAESITRGDSCEVFAVFTVNLLC